MVGSKVSKVMPGMTIKWKSIIPYFLKNKFDWTRIEKKPEIMAARIANLPTKRGTFDPYKV